MSIWVFGPIVAGLVFLVLCCGGCMGLGVLGQFGQGVSEGLQEGPRDQVKVVATDLTAFGSDNTGFTGTVTMKNTASEDVHLGTGWITFVIRKDGVTLFTDKAIRTNELLSAGESSTFDVSLPGSRPFVAGPYDTAIEWTSS
jgi:hypothetical protein